MNVTLLNHTADLKSGIMVRDTILLPKPDLHQNIHPAAVQADFQLRLDQARHPGSPHHRPSCRGLADSVCLHGMRSAPGFLGLELDMDDACVLPAGQPVVGEPGVTSRH